MSGSLTKPRYRITTDGARITPVYNAPDGGGGPKSFMTTDSFVNIPANAGIGANNLISASTYHLNPLSRNHVKLEFMYRGTWLVRKVVDAPANDMTRAGIYIESDMKPDDIDALQQYWTTWRIWKRLNSTLKWARLYGGCIAVIMIDGMKPEEPFDIRQVSKGSFRGLLVLDRWMVWPHVEDLVTDFGVDFGTPRYYQVVTDARAIPNMKVHHSRCIRLDGVELPYWQKIAENDWGLSCIEPFLDRMIAYDSATAGAAQLLYRACVRVLKVNGLRQLIGQSNSANQMYQAFLQYVQTMRAMQANENITVIDAGDDFTTQSYAFSGISDMLVQFGQQLSGAAGIPLTRLFGQAPAGMNATGESDMRNYYDEINAAQETDLRPGLSTLMDVTHRSCFGSELPKGFNYSFKPLWQMDDVQRASVANQITMAVDAAKQGGLVTRPQTLLKELRQWSRITGLWSNITDEDIQAAEAAEPPMPEELLGGGEQPGQQPDLFSRTEPPDARNMNGSEQGVEVNETAGNGSAATRPQRKGRNIRNRVRAVLTGDSSSYAMLDVDGLQVVIETPKNTRRLGYGWSVIMPCDYGYISGTSSAEGPREQMDAFVGPDENSKTVWVIEQLEPTRLLFDEHKVMLRFSSRVDALQAYVSAFNDGLGERRIGSVTQITTAGLKKWLQTQWQYGATSAIRRSKQQVSVAA